MSSTERPAHLAVISDRDALVWVLRNSRIAFPQPRHASLLPGLKAGDVLYIYTTRQCFKNPHRDRGRVIGKVTATSDLTTNLDDPKVVNERPLPYELDIRIDSLAPFGSGPDLSDRVATMTSFPKPERWSAYMRRSLVPLSSKDAAMFTRLMRDHQGRLAENLDGYLKRAFINLEAAK